MKLAILIFFFLFTQAFAGTCSPEVTWIHESGEAKPFKTAQNPAKYTQVEKQMIHKTVGSHLPLSKAVNAFADLGSYNDPSRPGSNAGDIQYFSAKGKVIAYVRHYPGDNEYGFYFQISSDNKIKVVGGVSDGDLYCK